MNAALIMLDTHRTRLAGRKCGTWGDQIIARERRAFRRLDWRSRRCVECRHNAAAEIRDFGERVILTAGVEGRDRASKCHRERSRRKSPRRDALVRGELSVERRESRRARLRA